MATDRNYGRGHRNEYSLIFMFINIHIYGHGTTWFTLWTLILFTDSPCIYSTVLYTVAQKASHQQFLL